MVLNHSGDRDISRSKDANTTVAANRINKGAEKACIRLVSDFSPELSKPFRGPRMWLPLQRHGLAAYRAALEEKCLLARYAHQRLMAMPGFEPGPEPDLSVVTFRYIPEQGSSDEFNRRLLETIIGQGRFFMSSTILDGQYTLRLAILSNRTHRDVIDDFLNALQSAAANLSGHINT